MKSWRLLGMVAVAGLALAGCLSPGTHEVTPTLRNNTATEGLWHTFGGTGCFWQRLSGTSGAPSDVIANFQSPVGPRYVQIKSTDAAFETHGCLPWVQTDGPFDHKFGAAADGSFPDGDYRVGHDIADGSYQASITGSCAWARVSGFTGEASDVIEQASGTATVTIEPSDVGFKSTGCGKWTKTS